MAEDWNPALAALSSVIGNLGREPGIKVPKLLLRAEAENSHRIGIEFILRLRLQFQRLEDFALPDNSRPRSTVRVGVGCANHLRVKVTLAAVSLRKGVDELLKLSVNLRFISHARKYTPSHQGRKSA